MLCAGKALKIVRGSNLTELEKPLSNDIRVVNLQGQLRTIRRCYEDSVKRLAQITPRGRTLVKKMAGNSDFLIGPYQGAITVLL
jgi:hypothetical protein